MTVQFLEQNLKPNYCSVITRSKRSYEFSITSYGKKPNAVFGPSQLLAVKYIHWLVKYLLEFYWMPGNVPGFYVCVLSRFSHLWLFVTPSTVALQAPPSMVFSRQKYWSGLPRLSPGDLPNPVTEHASLTSLCIDRQILYYRHHLGNPKLLWNINKQNKVPGYKRLHSERSVKERQHERYV